MVKHQEPDTTVIINYNPQLRVVYDMKRGDIILYSGSGPTSWLIRKITGYKWSHVAWILSPRTILESDAKEGGVTINPIQTYVTPNKVIKGKTKIVRLTHVDPGLLENAIEASLKKVGQRYDYSSIFHLAWMYFLRFFGIKINMHDCKTNRQTCVELIARPMLKHANWRCFDEVDIDETVPGHFDITDKTKEI